ncbi:MAG TPA: hypothetical protein VK154_10065 [Chitinophagales bacterium]|nr:hypothetical protein [Chitinophagales bacterium]
MKHFTFLVTLLLLLTGAQGQDNVAVVRDFFKDVPAATTEKVSNSAPVASVDAIAKKHAAKTISLTKENIAASLNEAKQFKYGVLVVGGHTFVKIDDFTKCYTSGSWGACMPYGKGYIKKGALVAQNDYINNIIGRPDGQVRTLYLFN